MKDKPVGQSVQEETQSKNGRAAKREKNGASRRQFLAKAGGATAAMAAGVLGHASKAVAQTDSAVAAATTTVNYSAVSPQARRTQAFKLRIAQAVSHLKAPLPAQVTNGDALYADKGGVFTKALVHDDFGRVDLVSSYPSYIKALTSGKAADFENIILGPGGRTLNGPQGGLRYQLEGADTAAFASPPAPTIAGAITAAEMVELYWGALLRDVEFNDYANNATAQAAAAELNGLAGYTGPRNSAGQVTTNELFRGGFSGSPSYFPQGNSNYFPGELTGPYVSQFAILPTFYGAQPISQQWQVFLPANGGGAD
jgi:hypothetical protein